MIENRHKIHCSYRDVGGYDDKSTNINMLNYYFQYKKKKLCIRKMILAVIHQYLKNTINPFILKRKIEMKFKLFSFTNIFSP